ncbi:MAG: hypothetical protein AMXMBFR13_06580 [Phycisphaerae bacterium]
MNEASNAGYTAMMIKAAAPLRKDGSVDFTTTDELLDRTARHRLQVVMAILGWAGLGRGQFWDTDESGARIPDRLDPFWPEAMQRVESYFQQVIQHYADDGRVVTLAPTWGIYGEAGFTSYTAGRSEHALARFNEWRQERNLEALAALPTRRQGPNTDYSRFIHFRYLYLEHAFDQMIRRLKPHARGKAVGMWQELYPVIGYLYTMVEVPSADFALYESCFPFQTSHHPEKTLAETLGFRYRCRSAEDYHDYYLPLLARKRGEGQRFMGCQLSNHYAVKNYGWSEAEAQRVRFDEWEDDFAPHLKRLHDAPIETPERDVLLVFPTYAAAALSDRVAHSVDTMLMDVLLRMFGCQMVRMGSPRFDRLTVEELNRYRLIVVPCSAFLLSNTHAKLQETTATVLFTGCFAQSYDGVLTPFGQSRTLNGDSVDEDVTLHYFLRPAGPVTRAGEHPLTQQLSAAHASLPEDESFDYVGEAKDTRILLRCGESALLSIRRNGRSIFIHGHLLAGLCHDPDRKPPAKVGGSADPSANEHDPWGPHSSTHPQNAFARQLVRAILDHAKVKYRVADPAPRQWTPYLSDHMEAASISANIAYNNTAEPQTIRVRLPYAPKDLIATFTGGGYETSVRIPPFRYVVLEPQEPVE